MTLEEIKTHSAETEKRMETLKGFLKIDEHREKIAELEDIMAKPDFWDNKDEAQNTVQKLSSEKSAVEPFLQLQKEERRDVPGRTNRGVLRPCSTDTRQSRWCHKDDR